MCESELQRLVCEIIVFYLYSNVNYKYNFREAHSVRLGGATDIVGVHCLKM